MITEGLFGICDIFFEFARSQLDWRDPEAAQFHK